MIIDLADAEPITDLPGRRLWLLATTPQLTVTLTRHAPGQEGTALHVHHEHVDAFFVLEGELSLPLGPDGTPVTLAAGGWAAVPPGVAHAFVNVSDAEASWLNLHVPDGGFIDFLRAIRDGTGPAAWDAADPPAGGGRPAEDVDVVADGAAALRAAGVTVLDADPDTLRLELHD